MRWGASFRESFHKIWDIIYHMAGIVARILCIINFIRFKYPSRKISDEYLLCQAVVFDIVSCNRIGVLAG